MLVSIDFISSTMINDQASDSHGNLGPHSHLCPAKDLALDILTRIGKHFAESAWIVDTVDVDVTEFVFC